MTVRRKHRGIEAQCAVLQDKYSEGLAYFRARIKGTKCGDPTSILTSRLLAGPSFNFNDPRDWKTQPVLHLFWPKGY